MIIKYFNTAITRIGAIVNLIDDNPGSAKEKLIGLKTQMEKIKAKTPIEFEFENNKNQDFIRKLSHDFPNISNTEIKLCVLIRQGLTSKEIAVNMHQSPDSIKVLRYRLRKKLGLASGNNLSTFLCRY